MLAPFEKTLSALDVVAKLGVQPVEIGTRKDGEAAIVPRR